MIGLPFRSTTDFTSSPVSITNPPVFSLFLFGKSIRQEKDRGKEKSKSKVKETKGVFFFIQAGIERPSSGRWWHGLFGP
jgi:hypothetical protein